MHHRRRCLLHHRSCSCFVRYPLFVMCVNRHTWYVEHSQLITSPPPPRAAAQHWHSLPTCWLRTCSSTWRRNASSAAAAVASKKKTRSLLSIHLPPPHCSTPTIVVGTICIISHVTRHSQIPPSSPPLPPTALQLQARTTSTRKLNPPPPALPPSCSSPCCQHLQPHTSRYTSHVNRHLIHRPTAPPTHLAPSLPFLQTHKPLLSNHASCFMKIKAT